MKKIKKLLAMIMAMTMVLGMAMTVSAASNQASITINGLKAGDNTSVRVYPVVVWDDVNNAWKVSDWVTPGNITVATEPTNAEWDGLKTDAETRGTAVYDETVNTETVTIDGLDIGMYLILVDGDTVAYEIMGVQTYTYENNNLIGPLKAEVYAKGSSYPITKTFTDEDSQKIVGYGDIIHYDITTTFPSFAPNSQDKTFWIKDTPDGLSIQSISVKVGESTLAEGTDYTITPSVPATLNTPVTVEFTDDFIGTENTHVGQPVVVTVEAKVETTGTYTNTAESNKGSGETEISRDTGSIKLTKVDTSGKNILTGAKFEIYDADNNKLSFVTTGNADEYRPAIASDMDARTELEVGDEGPTKGQIIIVGLKEGIYTIKETKAPDGYAVLGTDIVKEIKYTEDNQPKEDQAIHLEFKVTNTKLANLPSTGGIGTTIFTIGGCAIMIAAAALYFVNRRKSEEN